MEQSKEPYVLVLGVSICDIIGFAGGSFKACDSNPGKIKVSFGGVCRNIAENMARIGVNTKLISVIGDDPSGHEMLEYAKEVHLDMTETMVVKGESTPTYLAVLDDTGEMVAAIVDMKVMDYMTTEFVDSKKDIINASEYMVIGADNPEIIEHLTEHYSNATKLMLDPVSASKVCKIKHLIPYFHTIKPNRHEAEILCGFEIRTKEDVRKAGDYFRDLGVQNVFISLDADGIYYHNGKEEGIVKANNVEVVNVTGAGDALLAGISHGYMNNLHIEDTVKLGVAMSTLTIAHVDTIHPEMDYMLVKKSVDEIEWETTTF